MLILGLTGGIGAGKSTVAQVFQSLGLPVYNSDYWAKYLTQHDPDIRQNLIKWFGESIYRSGELDRTYLAQKIFTNPENLERVNGLIHPRVAQHYQNWLKEQKTDWCLKESALLFENHLESQFDKIITVYAPVELRIKRVLNRDKHRTRADVLAIISKQSNDDLKIQKSDWVIYNDERPLLKQIIDIYQQLKY